MKITELNLKNKRVLLRVDFNVPLDESGQIVDPTRIKAALPTIEYILKQGASLILMSHLGRPKGKKDSKYSLKPCAEYLSTLLHKAVFMETDCIGEDVVNRANRLKPGEILLLENLRFYDAEEHPEKDPSFAKQLATLADVYINDAFGTAHRKHSSTYTIAHYFPQKKAAGFLFEKEIQFLGRALQNPERPFYALLGGAKISSKLGVIHSLLEKVDALFIGGAMAYTFMAALGIAIGNSFIENDLKAEALSIYKRAKEKGVEFFLPLDVVVTTKEKTHRIAITKEGFKEGEEGVDIGPQTILFYSEKLKKAKTLFWNGPFGKYEEKEFAKGTIALLKKFACLDAITIIGGGDLVAAAMQAHVENHISHLSTGGGATLEYIEKNTLPALEVLE